MSPAPRSARFAHRLGRAWLVTISLAAPLAAIDGALDTTFHATGKFHEGSPGSLRGEGVLVAPDGALVLYGGYQSTAPDEFVHWRRITDSGFDAACNTRPTGLEAFEILAGAFDASGRLLLAGQIGAAENQLVVARYLYPACSLDTSFNGDGYFQLQLDRELRAFGLGVQASGKVVVAANYFANPANSILLTRLTDGGIVDGTFGDGGFATYDPVGTYDFGYAMKLDRLGRPVVAGSSQTSSSVFDPSMLALRFTADGALDATFAGDGSVVVPIHLIVEGTSAAYGVAISPENRPALVGYAETSGGWSPAVALFDTAGHLDASFSGDGIGVYWTSSSSHQYYFADAVFQGDDRLVGVGAWNSPTTEPKSIFAMRLTPDGDYDGTFGLFATVLVDFDLGGGDNDYGQGVALENGRIVIAGSANRDADHDDGVLVRLTNGYVFADLFESGGLGEWSAHHP